MREVVEVGIGREEEVIVVVGVSMVVVRGVKEDRSEDMEWW